MWNFHVDDLQKNIRYDMILGKEILSKLKFTYVFPTTLSGKNEARTKDVQPQ